VEGLGLSLVRLLVVLGRHHGPLAAKDLPAPVAQPLPDTVVGPAALAHPCTGMRTDMGVSDFFGGVVELGVFVRAHLSRVPCSPSLRQGRKSREDDGPRRSEDLRL
jgi:hypothetical protein